MVRIALSTTFALTLFACGATADSQSTTPGTKAADESSGTVCREESVTGSNMSRTVCRTTLDRAHKRREAEQFYMRTGRENRQKIK